MIYRSFYNKSNVVLALPRTDGNYSYFTLGTIEFESGYLECHQDIKSQTFTVTDRVGPAYVYYDEIPDKIKHDIILLILERNWNT